ncbi:hypothetical protein H2248_001653 [Termitomyces sp. 'cryptogamus']|nr:hypothetical protein H2248_001653 [Termitomyces sp. 'cryptogamus']
MSISRVVLAIIQAVCNHYACTVAPNPTPTKARYHTEQLLILRIAPLVFKVHSYILWVCVFFEATLHLRTLFPIMGSPSPISTSALICPFLPSESHPAVYTTPLFVVGVIAVALGTYIRLDCYRTLGHLFTFELAVEPNHKLVKERFYSYVRHPAYTGAMLIVIGIALSHLSKGAWLTSCGPFRIPGSAIAVCTVWWVWALCVVCSRAQAEDDKMRKLFKEEWVQYAADTPWWFLPGVY